MFEVSEKRCILYLVLWERRGRFESRYGSVLVIDSLHNTTIWFSRCVRFEAYDLFGDFQTPPTTAV
jgi:hypothetical protein